MSIRLAVLSLSTCTFIVSSCSSGDMVLGREEPVCLANPPATLRSDEERDATPGEWHGPVFVWTGSPGEAPGCPKEAPTLVYEGYAGLSQRLQCPACSCGPSVCMLTGFAVHSNATCDSAYVIPYPPPAGWDGSCVSSGVFYPEEIGSVEFLPLIKTPCEVLTEPAGEQTPLELTWAEQVMACQVVTAPAVCGESPPGTSAARAPPPGFSRCAFREGVQAACPSGYPIRSVFHGGVALDPVGCTPCRCATPEGGACRAFMTSFEDPACSDLRGGLANDTEQSLCTINPGDAFGGMTAEWQQNEPGTCAPSGGEPFGEAVPVEPVTFCCEVGN